QFHNNAFNVFLKTYEDDQLAMTPSHMSSTFHFIVQMADIYTTEDNRQMVLNMFLSTLLNDPIRFGAIEGGSMVEVDVSCVNLGKAATIIIETRNEFCVGAVDPIFQGIVTYCKYFSQQQV